MPGTSYKYRYPDEASTQYLYETYPDVSFVLVSAGYGVLLLDVQPKSSTGTHIRTSYLSVRTTLFLCDQNTKMDRYMELGGLANHL